MRTVDDMEVLRSPLPLDVTPMLMRFLGWPLWRYRDHQDGKWVYVTAAQYRRLFGK